MNIKLSFSIILFFLITTSLTAYPQEETMEINSPDFGTHTRPLVMFPHMLHEDQIDCGQCHHDYDASGENIGGDGGRCAECHTQKAGSNPIPLMDAFHLQCKRCHAIEINTSDNKDIPQMCGQCHIRKR